MKLISLLMILTPVLSLSFSQFGKQNCTKDGFLPKNDMYIPVDTKMMTSGITETSFNDVINKVEKIFTPIVRKYGGQLKFERLWSDGTVNASASRLGQTYLIKMYGGLARHHTITQDAFALVACHEIGHHIGGVPRYSDSGGTWASVEGQSDYFATAKCLRLLFENDDNEKIVDQLIIDPLVKEKCDSEHTSIDEQLLCKRISMAGLSSASLFAAMKGQSLPRFETPDPSVVNVTYESHPAYQCRLDTYFSGAICSVDKYTEIGQNDPNIGACNRADQFKNGNRPLCWFKPQVGTPSPNPTPQPPTPPTPPLPPTPPEDTIAATPHSNGSSSVVINNPNIRVPITIDVSAFQDAMGLAIEISKPNRRFSNPNGQTPDRYNGLGVKSFKRTKGVYNLLPRQELPGYGTYQIRVIGLDIYQNPVSRFSDSFELSIFK